MLKEAIETLLGLYQKGDAGRWETRGGIKTRMSQWVQGGKTEWVEHDPPIRNHEVQSLDSLVAIAGRYKDKCSVWHCEKRVCVLLDDEWRDDAATFALDKSSAWESAMRLSTPHAQSDLVYTFRTDLKDVVAESSPELIGLFVNVRFKRRDDSAATIDHGRESLGRELEKQVTGTEKLPEEVTFMLRPYIAVESESQVRLALKVNFDKETFTFKPVGDDVATAIDAAQDVIAERFRGVTDKVYYGTP